MIISNAQIVAYKSIFELELPLEPRVSILIGANESGKTNILKALQAFRFDRPYDTTLTCQYSDHYYQGKCPEIELEFTGLTKENRRALITVSEVFKDAERFVVRRMGPEMTDYQLFVGDQQIPVTDPKRLLNQLPKLLYFDSIPLIKNRVDYASLVERKEAYRTERNLLKIGGVDDFDVLFEDSTRGRRASEEASRVVTEQVRKVWSQEPSIEVKLSVNGKVLYIDMADSTTVYDSPESRSLGFRWYLSFYINFIAQTFDGRDNEYFFLIDEPGIHLHPAGQKDLNAVIENLASRNQIALTTHSPFMINREHPERVRLVYKDRDGTRVDTESYRQNWKPLRKSIGLMIGDLFFFNDSAFAPGIAPAGPPEGNTAAGKLKFWPPAQLRK